ncbi:MAG: InlB B-repeat-containing protein [Bacteroidales bacterium]|nr:InlB B-repeat-containing protein [Bacteroidales bacterium]
MKQNLLKTWLMLVCLIAGVGSVWAENYATWTFASGTAGTNYPANKTNFAATSGSCSESVFYLNGSGSTWNSTKGYAFTAVTDMTVTLKLTADLAAGSNVVFAADMYYNKDSNAPMTGFNLSVSVNGGSYEKTGLSATSLSLSNSSANKSVTYTTQTALKSGDQITLKYTQTGKVGSGQGYVGNITIDGPALTSGGGGASTSYTVKFNAGINGTCSTPSLTETSVGAGIILPSVIANAGYTFKGWATNSGSTTANAGTAGATYRPSADCTLYAVYAPIYTYNFYVNGTTVSSGSVEEGATITTPSKPEDINGKKFIGWVTTEIESPTDTKPSLVTPATKMSTSNLTYYALFATVNGSGVSTWKQVTTLANLAEGTYVIKNGDFVLSNETTSSAPIALDAPAITDGVISGTVEENMKWTFTLTAPSTTDKFYIKNAEGKYLYETNNNNGLRVNTTSDSWTIEEYGTNTFCLQGKNNSRYCGKYKDGTDWRSYTSKNATNYVNSGYIELYKLTLDITYSGYCTTVTTPLHSDGTINFVATTGNNKYYATFSSNRAIKFDEAFINEDESSAATIKAYAVTLVDGELHRTDQCEVNNDGNYTYIPANTGILFEYVLEDGEFDGAVPFEYADAEAEYLNSVDDNMLVACPTTGTCPIVEGNNNYYKLAYGDNTNKTKLGFWFGAEDGSGNFKVKAGGAVLCVPQSAGVKGFSLSGGDETAIENLMSNNKQKTIYNLQGVKLQKLQKGVNIVNGRKVIR